MPTNITNNIELRLADITDERFDSSMAAKKLTSISSILSSDSPSLGTQMKDVLCRLKADIEKDVDAFVTSERAKFEERKTRDIDMLINKRDRLSMDGKLHGD
jgi:hypothetical protein